jgi:GDP-L-fucose synthase
VISKTARIYVSGHKGMVGSAVWRALETRGYSELIGRNTAELDLRDQLAVNRFFQEVRPEVVINAAAKVGGILANSTFPYQFLMDNLQIQNNVINGAFNFGVEKFIFLGSSCIYPKLAAQPINERQLLTGPLEATNEWYAIAKIAGLKACEAIRAQYERDFISLMPTNLYGYHDNFDLESSHVLPAILRKMHEAKLQGKTELSLWGTGRPRREFLFVDDMAEAVMFVLEKSLPDFMYNVGTGTDISIKELAVLIKDVVGFEGNIIWDDSMPDGTPRKLLDVSGLKELGWQSSTELDLGIRKTYRWFLDNIDETGRNK